MEKPDYEKAKQIASTVLEENSILKPPILPDEIARAYGLNVVTADFGEKYKAVSGFLDIKKEMIFVNKKEPVNRQTFTVAHELGHWFLHKDIIQKDESKYSVFMRSPLAQEGLDYLEKEANCFAANLLVPREFLDKYKNIADESDLAIMFMVSEEVVRFRLKFEYGK